VGYFADQFYDFAGAWGRLFGIHPANKPLTDANFSQRYHKQYTDGLSSQITQRVGLFGKPIGDFEGVAGREMKDAYL